MMSSHTQQDEHLDAVIAGTISASDNLAAFLASLESTEDDVKAWCLLSDMGAYAQAEACDSAPVRGVLHGVGVGPHHHDVGAARAQRKRAHLARGASRN